MFKAITFTDVHLADKNPGARIDNYRDAILGKLEQARDYCALKKADVAICGGDLFHIKTPTKNSHYLVSQTISILKSFPCPVYSVYGNHDLRQDNISTLPSQPFYTVMKAGAVDYLTEKFFDNGKIRLFGVDYVQKPENEDFSRENQGEKIQICVAHVNASSKFDDLFGERVYRYQDLAQTSPDIFVFGHYHPDQGIEVVGNKHFINVGSICRGSLKLDELSRIPNLGYIEIDDDYNISCSKIPLTVASSSEIFDLELKVKEDVEQKELERFIGEMKDRLDSSSEDDDIEEVIKSSTINFGKEIVDKAMFYYEKAL